MGSTIFVIAVCLAALGNVCLASFEWPVGGVRLDLSDHYSGCCDLCYARSMWCMCAAIEQDAAVPTSRNNTMLGAMCSSPHARRVKLISSSNYTV